MTFERTDARWPSAASVKWVTHMDETFKPRRPPTLTPPMAAAQDRIAAVQPDAYARTRNALDGAVSHLSPYITRGFVSLVDVLAGVTTRYALDAQHKFVYELASAIGAALKTACSVRSIDEPHLAQWLTDWATCETTPALFPSIDRRCDSFSKWWKHASRELNPAAGLLPARDIVRSEP